MLTLGIDVGSASSKAVILCDGETIVSQAVVQAGTGTSGPNRVLNAVFGDTGLSLDDIEATVATGYGRFSVSFADKQISEITCHAKGVYWLCPEARTIIDIGGQDVKSISLNESGNVKKFFMNDKCAAGTGRFLEVMARVLEVGLDCMEEYHFKAPKPAQVSSTCTVFAESEVISLLSQGIAVENIIAGVHQSVASKACALAWRAGVQPQVVMCGGVAYNGGVVDAIEKELKEKVKIVPNPQLSGALGAALFAYNYVISEAVNG